MSEQTPEAWIWIAVLKSALARLAAAEDRAERLAAIEAIEEAREQLDQALDVIRDRVLEQKPPVRSGVN